MILDFLARSWFFLDFLARLIAKIFARNLRNPRSWQQMKKIQDIGNKWKRSKILARNSRLSKIVQNLGKKTKTPSTGYGVNILTTFLRCKKWIVKDLSWILHEWSKIVFSTLTTFCYRSWMSVVCYHPVWLSVIQLICTTHKWLCMKRKLQLCNLSVRNSSSMLPYYIIDTCKCGAIFLYEPIPFSKNKKLCWNLIWIQHNVLNLIYFSLRDIQHDAFRIRLSIENLLQDNKYGRNRYR